MTIDGETIGIVVAVLVAVGGFVAFLLKTGAAQETMRQKLDTLTRKHDEGFAEIRPRMNGFEHRIATTEKDVVEMKAMLGGLEKSNARIEGALGQVQTGIQDSLRHRAEQADEQPRRRTR